MNNKNKSCRTCKHSGMDMDLDPYCAHPLVLKRAPYGATLKSPTWSPTNDDKECTMNFNLWEDRNPEISKDEKNEPALASATPQAGEKLYHIGIREVHISIREVRAFSRAEALEKADDIAFEIDHEYSHTMDKEYWSIEEID